MGPSEPAIECFVRVGVAIGCSSGNGWLEELDLPCIGVEPGAYAERQGPLGLDVPDGKAVGHRNTERLKVLGEYFIVTEGAVASRPIEPGEPADQHARQPAQSSDKT